MFALRPRKTQKKAPTRQKVALGAKKRGASSECPNEDPHAQWSGVSAKKRGVGLSWPGSLGGRLHDQDGQWTSTPQSQ
jgi:hypothetical protein